MSNFVESHDLLELTIHKVIQIFQLQTHPITQNKKKIALINNTTGLILKVLKYLEAVKLMVTNSSFPEFLFSL